MNPASQGCPLCQHNPVIDMPCAAHDSERDEKTVSIRACPACNFAWQWPLQRTADQSSSYFQAQYQGERESSYFDKGLRNQISRLQLQFLDELGIEKKTLLDIGCGDGSFATEAAQNGWTALGLDPALPPGIEQNAALAQLSLSSAGLEQLPPEQKFMCVTLWDVVEHLPEPLAVLKNAWERVAPGGWLILETGNYQSTERLLSGSRWWAWQLDHRWYFAPPTLLRLLEPFHYSESRLSNRVLRPWSSYKPAFKAPSLFQTALSVLKRPWKISTTMAEYGARRHAAAKWPQWAGLSIFTIAIKRQQETA